MTSKEKDTLQRIDARIRQAIVCPHCAGTGKCNCCECNEDEAGCMDYCEKCGGMALLEITPNMRRYRAFQLAGQRYVCVN